MTSDRAYYVSGGSRYHPSRNCPRLRNRDDVREGKGDRTTPCLQCLKLAGIEDGYRELKKERDELARKRDKLARQIEEFEKALRKMGVDATQVTME